MSSHVGMGAKGGPKGKAGGFRKGASSDNPDRLKGKKDTAKRDR